MGRKQSKSKRDESHRSKSKRKRNESRRKHKNDSSDDERIKEKKLRRRKGNEREFVESDSNDSEVETSYSDETSEAEVQENAIYAVRKMTKLFGNIKNDLQQLLRLIDNGQGVEIQGLPDPDLRKKLKSLFRILKLKKSDDGLYFLPKRATPTLKLLRPVFQTEEKEATEKVPRGKGTPPSQEEDERPVENDPKPVIGPGPLPAQQETREAIGPTMPPWMSKKEEEENVGTTGETADSAPVEPAPVVAEEVEPKKRILGPSIPSAAVLEAAAKMTEAQIALEETEEELGELIGPPPPAVTLEAEATSQDERIRQVERILDLTLNPFQILEVDQKATAPEIKKKYWKMSLLVHPDKCNHERSQEAFKILNEAFKELQDPKKRADVEAKIQDEIDRKEFEIELKKQKEAAEWRRLRGESLPGDSELLDGPPEAPKRESWMTELPPERKATQATTTTFFTRKGVSERGDASEWTDTPQERLKKAQQQYLEAFHQAAIEAPLKSQEATVLEASILDSFKGRSEKLSLLEEHQKKFVEEKKEKKKKKQKEKKTEGKGGEEWVKDHPWKPWNRETDLGVGRKGGNLEGKDAMVKGLSSRFSGGGATREFL